MLKSNVLLLLGRNILWSGDIRYGFRYFFRPILKGQICLCNDPDASAIPIDYRDTANLMLLHCLFAAIQILSVAAGYRILTHIFLDRCIFRIEALSNDRAAEVAVGNDPGKFAGLLIDNHGHGTHVMLAHDLGYALRSVARDTTNWVGRHYFSDGHNTLLISFIVTCR